MGGQHGNFELNVMLPVIAHNILQSIELLSTSADNFVNKCLDGIKANTTKCEQNAEASLAICTSLAPIIGYDQAAALAKQAYKEGKPLRQVASESGLLEPDKLSEALNLMKMTKPGE